MPVLVQNNQAGPTVFSDMKDNRLTWEGKGDPAGGDVQMVSDDLVTKDVNFLTAIRKGIFTVVEAPEDIQRAIDAQVGRFQARSAQAQDSALAAIDPEVNNDLVSLPCIGPATRGNGKCGEPVAVREKKADDAPVLCPKHASLAAQYVRIETGNMKETREALVPEIAWVRTQVTDPERAV